MRVKLKTGVLEKGYAQKDIHVDRIKEKFGDTFILDDGTEKKTK